MSAITGIFYRDGRKVDPQLMKKMNERLSHRGPDGSAIWCEGSVGLGHQMLWTTPESLHEKLPYHDKKAGLVITADARIDNRKELSKELNIEDKEDVSDSYFILKSYEKWGEKCPEYLLGDFAFAIWDENKEQLFCARDHMGVKPFYYYLDDDMFVFGTEIKAIFEIISLNIEIEEIKIGHHLIPISTERELTFYKNILRLPAAYKSITNYYDHNKINYWTLNPNLEIRFDYEENYYKKFYQLFQEAVRCRLKTPYKIGFELSGGIDSSSVVLMAKEVLKNEKFFLNTFSLVFDEIIQSNESKYIKKVVETGKINPYYFIADSISPFEEIEKIFFYLEEPPQTPNVPMIWQLYNEMQKNNIRIVLGGHDGDCLLYKGEKYLMELFYSFKWKRLFQELNNASKLRNLNLLKLFIDKVIFPKYPYAEKIWLKYKGIRKEKDFVNINKAFEKKYNLKKEYKFYFLDPYEKANTSKKIHYYYLTSGTHQMIFEMMDKLAGYFSIEPRHPMMDKRLLEFCYAVPTEIKYQMGWGRLLARKGLAKLLPHEIQWRVGKTNFDPVFRRNLLLYENDRLKQIINKNQFSRKYCDIKELNKIYNRYKQGKKGADAIDIWKIAILTLWIKEYKNNKYCC